MHSMFLMYAPLHAKYEPLDLCLFGMILTIRPQKLYSMDDGYRQDYFCLVGDRKKIKNKIRESIFFLVGKFSDICNRKSTDWVKKNLPSVDMSEEKMKTKSRRQVFFLLGIISAHRRTRHP